MISILIQMGAIFATVGPVTVEQEVEWPAVDALRLPAIVQPVSAPWPADAEPVVLEDEIRLAKNMELPLELPSLPMTVSLTSPEVPRR